MNKAQELDQEIDDLERKLTGGQKTGKKILRKELEEENMFELFSCVDHILKGKFRKGEDDGPISDEDDEDEGDFEDEHGQGMEEVYGEEEEDEEGWEEADFGGEEVEIEEKKVENEKKVIKTQNQTESTNLTKRAPNIDEKISFKPNVKVNDLADLLFISWKDNKELLTQVNRLCSFVHQNKLSGNQIAQAVLISNGLKQPANPSNLSAIKTKETKEEDKREKKFQRKDKVLHFASSSDRLKVGLYTLILFPRPYTLAFLKTLKDQSSTLFTWSLSGLLVLGAVHGQILVENLRTLKKNDSKTSIENLDYEVHLIGKVVREKEPGSFKELSSVLKERFANDPVASSRLTSHLEKLRNNMDIPGKTPFEVSNSVSKLLEKLIKKRRTDELKPVQSLSEIDDNLNMKKLANPSSSKEASQRAGSDVLEADQGLKKLAEKLGLVTQVEKKAFKIVNQSADYIEVVQGLINLKTHGSENKELACALVKCCLAEKTYNGFYAAATQKLISLKPEFKYSFQLALFDEIKELKEMQEDNGPSLKNLGLYSASLLTNFALDHKFFKFLDESPLPISSAKLCRIILDQMIKKMPKESLRLLSKKLTFSIDVASNLKRIAKYLAKRKKEQGLDPQLEERLVRWLDEVPGGPTEDEIVG